MGIWEASTTQILIHYGQAASAAQAGSVVLRSFFVVAIILGAGHLVAWQILRYYRNSNQVDASAQELPAEAQA